MKAAISEILGRLVGLPLWSVGRAGIEWFHFGRCRIVASIRGGTREVGEFALHLGCPWRLIGRDSELLACHESEPEVLAQLTSPPLVCCGVHAGDDGGFEMVFAGGERLQVEPGDADCLEYWRLFQPGLGQPHFVVGPSGIDPEG